MNTHVTVNGKKDPVVYENAMFSIGLSILVDRVANNGAVVKLTEYFATGDLWVFRMTTDDQGNKVRSNIAFFPSGSFGRAWMSEPKS